MIPQQAALTTSAKPNKELSENKKQNLQFVPNPPSHFCRVFKSKVSECQFQQCSSISHLEKVSCHPPKPTTSSTLFERQKIDTDTCMGCGETGDGNDVQEPII